MTSWPALAVCLALCLTTVVARQDASNEPPEPSKCERAMPLPDWWQHRLYCTYLCDGWPIRTENEPDGITCGVSSEGKTVCMGGKCVSAELFSTPEVEATEPPLFQTTNTETVFAPTHASTQNPSTESGTTYLPSTVDDFLSDSPVMGTTPSSSSDALATKTDGRSRANENDFTEIPHSKIVAQYLSTQASEGNVTTSSGIPVQTDALTTSSRLSKTHIGARIEGTASKIEDTTLEDTYGTERVSSKNIAGVSTYNAVNEGSTSAATATSRLPEDTPVAARNPPNSSSQRVGSVLGTFCLVFFVHFVYI
ncbi:uncharacterized protein LOC144144771 [Haemaphysalis longicornis]